MIPMMTKMFIVSFAALFLGKSNHLKCDTVGIEVTEYRKL